MTAITIREIIMKITRKQLRKIINESVYGTGKRGYSKTRPEDPTMHVSPEVIKKTEPLVHHDDKAFQRQGYDLATTLQRDMTVFPFEGEPYTRKPYEGDDYLGDLEKSEALAGHFIQIHKNLKNAYDAIKSKPFTAELKDNLMDAFTEAFNYTEKLAQIRGIPSDEINDLYNRLFRTALPED